MQVVLTQEQGQTTWENKCAPSGGCGTICCFWQGSPCEHLELDETRQIGRCAIYAQRFGKHHTVDGQAFMCAPASLWIQKVKAPDACGYANVLKVQGLPTIRGLMTPTQAMINGKG